jgi:prevent-host-death family protein
VKIDLRHGVIPITEAANHLAQLIKLAQKQNQPVIITKQGRPSAALVSIDLLAQLTKEDQDEELPA